MNKKIILIIVAIVVIVLIGWAIFAATNHGSAPQAQQQPAQAGANNQAQSGQPTAASANLYTSSADGFSVNFPSTPQITKTTFDSPISGSIPVTKYLAQSGSGSSTKYYAVDVYHYPQTYQFPDNYLTGAMDLFAMVVNKKYPGAKLTSSQSTQLSGNAAMAGTIAITIAGKQSENYLVITTKNHNTYGVGTYGTDQSDYNSFVNSFTFTQ